jgi:hypothetical protein
MEQTEARPGAERRLVLGFDAGCMTCSDLARRIEEMVSDKLEVRSLHDPQMAHWRKQAMGEEAPWAPTLVEVEPDGVEVWTGRRMGLVLASKLGLVATWRVMQVLGEMRATLKGAGSPGIGAGALTRGQFLKGLGGATVAMSLLSGVAAIPALANVQQSSVTSQGTLAQRKTIEDSVRSSRQYRSATRRAGLRFHFKRAEFAVNEALGVGAVVVVAKAAGGGRAAIATFFTDLEDSAIVFDSCTVQTKVGNARKVTHYENDERLTSLTFEDGWILLPDGRKIAYKQFEQESEQLGRQMTVPSAQTKVVVRARYCKNGCCRGSFDWCMFITRLQCTAMGAVNFWLGLACRYIRAYSNSKRAGCNAYATDRCYRLNRCGCPYMR